MDRNLIFLVLKNNVSYNLILVVRVQEIFFGMITS